MNFTFRKAITFILATQFIFGVVTAQTQFPRQMFGRQDYPRSGEKYITDEYGVIRMWVNVWGHVNKPGSHLVYEGIDLATLLSITGGPKIGANLKRIRLFRDGPDSDGRLTYIINMDKFLKTGDRSDFVKVLPNDTYVIPQTTVSYVISQVGLLNTIANSLYYIFLTQQLAKRK